MKQEIKSIILKSIQDLNDDLCNVSLENPDETTSLYGDRGGVLDSLALVNLIVDLEEKIESQLGKEVILSDEKAMSQKHSPFRSVKTLCDYIESLIEETN